MSRDERPEARLPLPLPEGYGWVGLCGRGSSALVVEAVQKSLGRRVALKILAPEELDADEIAVRFEQEARLLASLSHPSVVRIFDSGRIGDRLYLAMEWIGGPTLELRILDQAPMELDDARGIACSILGALDHVHEHGILHRDIKPANVAFAEGDRVVVLDFGLARNTRTSHRLTEPGTVWGSLPYLAPEILETGCESVASDLYSVGVVLYEMLTGERPMDRPTAAEVIEAKCTEDPPHPGRLRPDLPRDVLDLVHRALDRRPGRRPPDPRRFAEELAGCGRSASRTRQTRALETARRGRRWLPGAVSVSGSPPARATPTPTPAPGAGGAAPAMPAGPARESPSGDRSAPAGAGAVAGAVARAGAGAGPFPAARMVPVVGSLLGILGLACFLPAGSPSPGPAVHPGPATAAASPWKDFERSLLAFAPQGHLRAIDAAFRGPPVPVPSGTGTADTSRDRVALRSPRERARSLARELVASTRRSRLWAAALRHHAAPRDPGVPDHPIGPADLETAIALHALADLQVSVGLLEPGTRLLPLDVLALFPVRWRERREPALHPAHACTIVGTHPKNRDERPPDPGGWNRVVPGWDVHRFRIGGLYADRKTVRAVRDVPVLGAFAEDQRRFVRYEHPDPIPFGPGELQALEFGIDPRNSDTEEAFVIEIKCDQGPWRDVVTLARDPDLDPPTWLEVDPALVPGRIVRIAVRFVTSPGAATGGNSVLRWISVRWRGRHPEHPAPPPGKTTGG